MAKDRSENYEENGERQCAPVGGKPIGQRNFTSSINFSYYNFTLYES